MGYVSALKGAQKEALVTCMTYMIKNAGLPNESACAIGGNIYMESSFKIEATNRLGTCGLAQYLGSRKTRYLNWCTSNNKSSTDVVANIEYIVQHDPETPGVLRQMSGKSLQEQTEIWCIKWERPGKNERALDKRYAFAKDIYDNLSSLVSGVITTGDSSGTSSNSSIQSIIANRPKYVNEPVAASIKKWSIMYTEVIYTGGDGEGGEGGSFGGTRSESNRWVDIKLNFRTIAGWKGKDGKPIIGGIIYRGRDPKDSTSYQKQIKSEGITAIANLRQNEKDHNDKKPSWANDYDWEIFDIAGYKVNAGSEQKRCVEWIAAKLHEGKKVLFHCHEGLNRTGNIAGHLLSICGVSAEDQWNENYLSAEHLKAPGHVGRNNISFDGYRDGKKSVKNYGDAGASTQAKGYIVEALLYGKYAGGKYTSSRSTLQEGGGNTWFKGGIFNGDLSSIPNSDLLRKIVEDTTFFISPDGNKYYLANWKKTHSGKCTSGPRYWYSKANISTSWWGGHGSKVVGPDDCLLSSCGFVLIGEGSPTWANNLSKSQLQPGDICTQYTGNVGHQHGCMWNGTNWVSDFKQNKCWAYSGNKSPFGNKAAQLWRHKKFMR